MMVHVDPKKVNERYQARLKTDHELKRLHGKVSDRERRKQERIAKLQREVVEHRRKLARARRICKACKTAIVHQMAHIKRKRRQVDGVSHKQERSYAIEKRKRQLKKIVSAEIALETMKAVRRNIKLL
jgi:hypothetical protein